MKLAEKRKIVTRKIVEKAIELLETALKGEKETMEFTETLYKLFRGQSPDPWQEPQELSYHADFYRRFHPVYNYFFKLKDIKNPDFCLPFWLDETFSKNYKLVPKATLHRYFSLKSKMSDWADENNYDPELKIWVYSRFAMVDTDLEANMDYLYAVGLLITDEELGVEL